MALHFLEFQIDGTTEQVFFLYFIQHCNLEITMLYCVMNLMSVSSPPLLLKFIHQSLNPHQQVTWRWDLCGGNEVRTVKSSWWRSVILYEDRDGLLVPPLSPHPSHFPAGLSEKAAL